MTLHLFFVPRDFWCVKWTIFMFKIIYKSWFHLFLHLFFSNLVIIFWKTYYFYVFLSLINNALVMNYLLLSKSHLSTTSELTWFLQQHFHPSPIKPHIPPPPRCCLPFPPWTHRPQYHQRLLCLSPLSASKSPLSSASKLHQWAALIISWNCAYSYDF
jgi:hypothetical protein